MSTVSFTKDLAVYEQASTCVSFPRPLLRYLRSCYRALAAQSNDALIRSHWYVDQQHYRLRFIDDLLRISRPIHTPSQVREAVRARIEDLESEQMFLEVLIPEDTERFLAGIEAHERDGIRERIEQSAYELEHRVAPLLSVYDVFSNAQHARRHELL